jgi:transcriptional regulator with XRE-family HTH domain
MPHPPTRLREARLEAGLTQQELADLLGVAQQHVARWETGKNEPRASMAVRLSEALGTTANALWPADETPTR